MPSKHYFGIRSMSKIVLGGCIFSIIKILEHLSRPVLNEIIYNNVLELSLTRSTARKPQSFEGLKKLGPAEVKASAKVHLLKKVNWHAWLNLRIG